MRFGAFWNVFMYIYYFMFFPTNLYIKLVFALLLFHRKLDEFRVAWYRSACAFQTVVFLCVCVCVLGAILGVPGVIYPVSFVVVFQWRLMFWNHFQADMPLCLQIYHVYSFVFWQGYWCTGLLWVCWSLQGMSLYCLNIVMGNQKLITWLNWDSF